MFNFPKILQTWLYWNESKVTETKAPILMVLDFWQNYKHRHGAEGQIDPVLPEIGLSPK